MINFLIKNWSLIRFWILALGFITILLLAERYLHTKNLLSIEKARVATLKQEIHTLKDIHTKHQQLVEQLQIENTALLKKYTHRKKDLVRVINESPTTKNWSDTDVPDTIQRMLNQPTKAKD